MILSLFLQEELGTAIKNADIQIQLAIGFGTIL
jgi:hypothetical protein